MKHVLVGRLDSLGDMVICGPAIRAVAAGADRVSVLAGPRGREAAALLPGVDHVEVFDAPWIAAPAPPVATAEIAALIDRLSRLQLSEAVVLTSFHQSALPTALLLRMAGIARVAAVSEDYPGSLLDVRIRDPADGPEPVRMATIAAAAGYPLPPGDDGRLRLRPDLPPLPDWLDLPDRYVVVHPGADAAARTYPAPQFAAVAAGLRAAGLSVVVTGTATERDLTALVAAAGAATDLGGRLQVGQLAAVLRGADAVICANTGPAHLAAAVATPVVSLFSPVVPASRWAPFGVPSVVLGDQSAACRGSRARSCPIPGHPCLSDVAPARVVAAALELPAAARTAVPA